MVWKEPAPARRAASTVLRTADIRSKRRRSKRPRCAMKRKAGAGHHEAKSMKSERLRGRAAVALPTPGETREWPSIDAYTFLHRDEAFDPGPTLGERVQRDATRPPPLRQFRPIGRRLAQRRLAAEVAEAQIGGGGVVTRWHGSLEHDGLCVTRCELHHRVDGGIMASP